MFIEVYSIPVAKWNDPAEESKKDTNRRYINVEEIIMVRDSDKCANRAEIIMKDSRLLTVVGSYEEIKERISGIESQSKLVKDFGFAKTELPE